MRNRKLTVTEEENENRVPFVYPYFSELSDFAIIHGFTADVDGEGTLSFQRGDINIYLPDYREKAALIYKPDDPFFTYTIKYDRLILFISRACFHAMSDYMDISINS